MNTPDLIVIGAQKCGTTTIYEDLAQHPDISMTEKESALLLSSDDSSDIASEYARAHRVPGNSLVEVSTEYAMRPLHDVADLAVTVAPQAHIVYIVRDPIARVISHHHHEVAARTMSEGIDDAVVTHDRLIDYSRYAHQVSPWLDAFGPERVHVVQFEAYMTDRIGSASELYEIMGLAPFTLANPDEVHNAATDKRVAVGLGGRLANNRVYRQVIRPRVPVSAKAAAKRVLLPKAPPRPALPSSTTLHTLVDRLAPEVEELAVLTNSAPWWDLKEKWLA